MFWIMLFGIIFSIVAIIFVNVAKYQKKKQDEKEAEEAKKW